MKKGPSTCPNCGKPMTDHTIHQSGSLLKWVCPNG